jgi:hypothetical protein
LEPTGLLITIVALLNYAQRSPQQQRTKTPLSFVSLGRGERNEVHFDAEAIGARHIHCLSGNNKVSIAHCQTVNGGH